MKDIFPKCSRDEKDKKNLSIQLFGKRIYSDQTLEEYLLEFLLVFSSAKESLDSESGEEAAGKFRFHTDEQIEKGDLAYFITPRNGLKRFVFYERAKKESQTSIDDIAYRQFMEMLAKRSEDDPDIPLMIQDLLYGYSLVLKNRGWYAQSLIPIAPELIFPETLGLKERKNAEDYSAFDVETKFEYGKHDFLARGGEVYYLHLLKGISENPNGREYANQIEKGIEYLLQSHSGSFSRIANTFQEWWNEEQGFCDLEEQKMAKLFYKRMKLGYIRSDFSRRSGYSLQELATFLSNNIHPMTKIELLTKGIMLALLRAMHLQAFYEVNTSDTMEPKWIIDMRAYTATSNIGKLAAKSYREAYDSFGKALNHIYEQSDLERDGQFDAVRKDLKNCSEVFKNRSKNIQLVIPPKGGYERFSLSEDLVRFLVLAIVKPGHKMTFDTFLEKLDEHYGMIIGPDQYRRLYPESAMTGYFEKNKEQFQLFLKNCGLLRDLSDATSIVENPYSEVVR